MPPIPISKADLLQALADRDWRRLVPVLLALLLVVVVMAWGVHKLFWGDRLYHIHIDGEAQVISRVKLPKDYLSKMYCNVGLGGVRRMVRRDGTVWTRRHATETTPPGAWVQGTSAKFETKILDEGKYTLDIDISLPSAPGYCVVHVHRPGCGTRHVRVDLKPGNGKNVLEGKAPIARLVRRKTPRSKTRRRPATPTSPRPAQPLVPEGEGGEGVVETPLPPAATP